LRGLLQKGIERSVGAGAVGYPGFQFRIAIYDIRVAMFLGIILFDPKQCSRGGGMAGGTESVLV
jgi:hypothetical protein